MQILQRERFEKAGIPWEEIDKEMLDIIDILNFELGIPTKFCCCGHLDEGSSQLYIMFDPSVDDEIMRPFMENFLKAFQKSQSSEDNIFYFEKTTDMYKGCIRDRFCLRSRFRRHFKSEAGILERRDILYNILKTLSEENNHEKLG